ncbi:branched-chain amino acid ABC transporter permease [Petroclostridium sp. X23]|uniref:branched-chain amino acid ABC transporter permease n=1 Tax=Petroclostridium sp. X23 TaxID=3045146 RepID=UPI0024AE5E48|nr:branched-chain amino acid ABC transporter permease [Petroclostridium sp. X23]WHH61478.1 branched-chain amino acid ABC transporter permease [Petroclostridium sp. X23]
MFFEQLLNGLTMGAIYALIALGYSMVYGILQIINFAHGDIFMLGTFIALTLIKVLHVPFAGAFVIAMVITAMIGIIIERLAYRPLRMADRMAPLLSALGVSIFLANFAQLIWGTETHPFPKVVNIANIKLGEVNINNLQVYILLMSIVLMIILQLIVKKSSWGVAMRATSYHKDHARLMGINVDKVISLTFAVGSALAAAAGIMVGLYYDAVYPTMGYSAGLKAFTAAVLGGIGSIPGAMLGGLVLGVFENFGAAYLSSGYRDAIAFSILIIVLLVKPSGLLGKSHQQKV